MVSTGRVKQREAVLAPADVSLEHDREATTRGQTSNAIDALQAACAHPSHLHSSLQETAVDSANRTMQQLSSGSRDNPDFLAGFAFGMQLAHGQALDQVKMHGAMEVRVLMCQQEQSRLQDRLGKMERALACSAGLLGSTLKHHAERLTVAETATSSTCRRLDRTSMRVESLERRTLLATATRSVQCVWGVFRRCQQAMTLLHLRCEQKLCILFAASWLLLRVVAVFVVDRRVSCRQGTLLDRARHWSWFLFLVSSQRDSRRILARALGVLTSAWKLARHAPMT